MLNRTSSGADERGTSRTGPHRPSCTRGTRSGRHERLRGERGTALIAALGMVMVLTIMAAAMIEFSTSSERSARVSTAGRGTIYASGKIALAGSQRICAEAGCDFSTGAWHPDQKLLVLVAGSTSDDPAFTLGQSMQMQGALYSATGFTQGNSVKFQGPVIANTVTISSSSQAKYVPFSTLPPGTPSAGGTTVSIIPGSWDD